MLKRLISLCVVALISNNALSDNKVFSCETENGKDVYLLKDNENFIYKAINAKTGKEELTFKNKIKDVKEITPEDNQYTGRSLIHSYEMKNGNYSYILTTSTDRISLDESSYITILKDGKEIKDLICKSGNVKQEQLNNDQMVYDEGMYKVGTDIPAGEYKLTAKEDRPAIIFVMKTPNRTIDSIISHNTFRNQGYVSVENGQYLKVNGATFKKVD